MQLFRCGFASAAVSEIPVCPGTDVAQVSGREQPVGQQFRIVLPQRHDGVTGAGLVTGCECGQGRFYHVLFEKILLQTWIMDAGDFGLQGWLCLSVGVTVGVTGNNHPMSFTDHNGMAVYVNAWGGFPEPGQCAEQTGSGHVPFVQYQGDIVVFVSGVGVGPGH